MKRYLNLTGFNFIGRIIAAITILFLTGCSSTKKGAPTPTPLPTSPASSQTTYLVQRGDVVGQIRFSGSVVPIDQKSIYFQTSGHIRKVYVEKGHSVAVGQRLADLDGIIDLEKQLLYRKLDYRSAQINAEIAQLNIDYYNETTSGDTSGYETQLAIKERELELAQIKVEELTADLQALEESITDTIITAPINGVIVDNYAKAGMEVNAYQPVMSVADISKLEVSTDISGDIIAKLAVGMPVTISSVLDSSSTLSGKIRILENVTNNASSEDLSTRITIDGSASKAGYDLGKPVYIDVVLQKRKDVLWVPPQAIRTYEGRQFVVIQENDVQRRVDVKIGVEGDDRVEILEGLSEGQVVVGP